MSRRTVAYIRRSVARKSDPGDISRAFQTAKVRELAGQGGPGLVVIDQDWGRSAARDKTDKRLAFLGLLKSIEAGEVSTLYAYSADRLARSVRWAAQLIDACEDAGTTIVTSEGHFPPGDTGARMVFQVLAIGNEHALASIVQKSNSGVAARRARGDEFGSFRYGYRTARQPDGSIKWERDATVPLDQVLEVVRARRGNIQASCVELDKLGILAPRGGKSWGTSALTRIVDREEPGVRPKRNAAGKRQPTRSVLTGLVPCPHCRTAMTPVGTRDALYCHLGRRTTGHGKYFTKDAAILALLHSLTDGRTFTRLTWARTSPDAATLAKAEERWRRVNVRYQVGGISDEEYGVEVARWKAAAKLGADDDEWAIDRQPGNPFVRWGDEPRLVNEDLRRLFLGVRLDPVTLAPVDATWRNKNLARPGLQAAG